MTALTPRQAEIMALRAEGLSNKEIGRRLGVSPRTVETHALAAIRRQRIMAGAAGLNDLDRYALDQARAHGGQRVDPGPTSGMLIECEAGGAAVRVRVSEGMLERFRHAGVIDEEGNIVGGGHGR